MNHIPGLARLVLPIMGVAALFSGACASNNGPRFRSAEGARKVERLTFADCAEQLKAHREHCYEWDPGQDLGGRNACFEVATRAFERCIDRLDPLP